MDKNKKLNSNLANNKAKTFIEDINLKNENSSFNQADNSQNLNNQSNLNNTNNNSNYEKSTKGKTI